MQMYTNLFDVLNLAGQRVVPNLTFEQFAQNKPLYTFSLTASDHISNDSLPLIKDGKYTVKVLISSNEYLHIV